MARENSEIFPILIILETDCASLQYVAALMSRAECEAGKYFNHLAIDKSTCSSLISPTIPNKKEWSKDRNHHEQRDKWYYQHCPGCFFQRRDDATFTFLCSSMPLQDLTRKIRNKDRVHPYSLWASNH